MSDDKTEMKIWKTAPIKLSEKEGNIISVIPMKIWAKFKYGTDFMGLNDTREINLNGTITLNSKTHLTNWKLSTNSKLEDFEWSESPSITVAGKKVPITYIINPTLSIFKSKIAKKIDKAIDETCDFKPQVLKVLENLSAPFLTSEQYETWFKMVPMELYVTEAKLSKSKITFEQGREILQDTFKNLNFSDLKSIKFVGDGTYLEFNDKFIEIRPSGTDAKTKAYGAGNNKADCINFAKLLGVKDYTDICKILKNIEARERKK